MGAHAALPADQTSLVHMLGAADALVRERAAYGLGRFRPTEDIITALGNALCDPDDEVCIAAAVSLFGFGPRARPAVAQLTKAIPHRNSHVSCLVIATLSSIGAEANTAVPAITEQLESPDPNVRMWSKTALKNISQGDR